MLTHQARRVLGLLVGVAFLSVSPTSGWTPTIRAHTYQPCLNPPHRGIVDFSSFCISTALFLATDDDYDNESSPSSPLTSAILKVSYDGTRFTGWSSANDPKPGSPQAKMLASKGRRRRRRRRGSSIVEPPIKGFVRSVQGVLQQNLAKLYGNIDPQRIVVEGSSRTDKGVHAKAMIVMIYGLQQQLPQPQSIDGTGDTAISNATTTTTSCIPGKSLPHPYNSTDSSGFLPVPMKLDKLAFTLNRMLPHDVRIVGIAATPPTDTVFHPSISTASKTYIYQFALINSSNNRDVRLLEPTNRRHVWNIKNMGATAAVGDNRLDLDKMNQACQIMQGTHDFSYFQGAPRGPSDKEKRQTQSGICTIESISVQEIMPNHRHPVQSLPVAQTYAVQVTGDRFLYKMVRFLVGALVDIGLGNANLGSLEIALDHPSHPLATTKLQQEETQHVSSSCAPAHGLMLHSVQYNITFDWQPFGI